MKSSLYTVPAGEDPEWDTHVPHFGWVYVTRPDLPVPPDANNAIARAVIHCAPGTEPPINAVATIAKGHEQPWQPESLVNEYPVEAPYVLEAVYITGDKEKTERPRIRCKMIEVPADITPEETNLVPHEWAGDE
jgi:hypothetical protein